MKQTVSTITENFETRCGRCGSSGQVQMLGYRHQRPHPKIPCTRCNGTGKIQGSLVKRCQRALVCDDKYEPGAAYWGPRNAPAMAEWALGFVRRNTWCGLQEAVSIAYQGAEFHAPGRDVRARRKEIDAEVSRRRGQLGPLSSRRKLLEQLAGRRSTTPVLLWLSSWHQGRMSPTVWSLLTPSEQTSALARLGYTAYGHSQILHHDTINSGRL